MLRSKNTMRLSANELKFLIKRSLEGMGFNPGEQLGAGVRMARACQYGLVDSGSMRQALDDLKPNINAPIRMMASSEDASLDTRQAAWHYDAGGQSALVQADLAVGAAWSHGITDITIHHTSQGILLAPTLMNWLGNPHGSNTIQQSVGLITDCILPHDSHTQYQHKTQDNTPIPVLLLLDATGALQALYHLHSVAPTVHQVRVLLGEETIKAHVNINKATLLVNQTQFSANLDTALTQGISISAAFFKHLQALMLHSLVPESATSAAGAGPG